MKYNKIISAMAGILAIGAVSCTDTWDEHYDAAQMGNGISLWNNMKANPELSNFVKLLEATGYDHTLASSQVLTVFAPTNSSLTDYRLDSLIQRYKTDSASVVKFFIQNHIAPYNYTSLEEQNDTTVRLLNGKRLSFGSSSFGGTQFQSKNLAASNGMLYTMSDLVPYRYNIYEYIKEDDEKNEDMRLDSLANFLYKYHEDELIEKESVPGDIVNGQQQYLERVTRVKNTVLTDWLSADLNSEDSTYYSLCPTNKVWREQLERNQQLFCYSAKAQDRDSLSYFNPRVMIFEGTQFSKSQNPKIDKTDVKIINSTNAIVASLREYAYGSDTCKYYTYDDPYKAGNVFADATEIDCSNGKLFRASKWNAKRRDTFLQDIVLNASGSNVYDSLNHKNTSWGRSSVLSSSPFYEQVPNHAFNTLSSSTSAIMPGILFTFRDVLSNIKYDLYVVTVPALATDTLTTDTLPTWIHSEIYYRDLEGNECHTALFDRTWNNKMSRETTNAEDAALYDTVFVAKGDQMYNYGFKINNKGEGGAYYDCPVDPLKGVQHVKIGTFKFPTCSYGLSESEVKVFIQANVDQLNIGETRENGGEINRLNIARIYLKPHEE